MIIAATSHLDHGLSPEAVGFIRDCFASRREFFTETVALPDGMTAPCGLHGPLMGDAPVPDAECRHERRGNRRGLSRVCDRPVRQVGYVTVIAGPSGADPCVLYTAYGGRFAPREPWDTALDAAGRAEAAAFWAQHALSRGA